MKQWLKFAGALCAVVLSGCAYHGHGAHHGRGAPPRAYLPSIETRTNPQVTIENGQVVVSPNILLFGKLEGALTITWHLPEGGRVRFDEKDGGVRIEGELLDRVIRDPRGRAQAVALNPDQTEISCPKELQKRYEVKCQVRNSKYGIFKYTLRVFDGDKLVERDPGIVTGADM